MMRALLLVLAVIVSGPALAAAPQCVNVGTRTEGWLMPDGKIKYGRCKNMVAVCAAVGTKSEGWYEAGPAHAKRLRYDNCASDQSRKPECVAIGTKSEGWKIDNNKIIYDRCARKIAACLFVGTRSEGWYAVKVGKLIYFEQCSGKQ